VVIESLSYILQDANLRTSGNQIMVTVKCKPSHHFHIYLVSRGMLFSRLLFDCNTINMT
jgi:hypothetical protein